MNHTPARIIAQLLIDAEKATDPTLRKNWPAFYGKLPDNPDIAIAVYNSTPVADGRNQRTGEKLFHHGIQVRVRADDSELSGVKCSEIGEYFDTVARDSVTLDSNVYRIDNISRTSGPIALGQETGRSRFSSTLNALITLVDITP
jgi:hypothetical protein